jgi:hypothetical protein
MRIASLSRILAGVCVGTILSAAAAHAGDLYEVNLTSDGSNVSRGFNTANQAIDQFKNGGLANVLPSYTDTSIASGVVNFQGLTVLAAYNSTGTTLNFQVPSLGINQSFTGATRDDSQHMLLDYLEKGNEFGNIMKALVATSPVDPIAGNPTSLQTSMVDQGFDSAFNAPIGGSGQTVGQSALGIEYGHFTDADTSTNSYTVPLGHSFVLGPQGSGYSLNVDAPLTYQNTQGAQTGAASLGLGLTIPVTPNWYVTPRIAGGVTGSLDLAAAAALVSGSVTSSYRFIYRGYGFIIGNMIGYSHSLDVSVSSYSANPNIENTFTKDGVMVDIPTSKLGFEVPYLHGSSLQLFVTDTAFIGGTKLYENNFQEVGFNIGSSQTHVFGHQLPFHRTIRLGLTYLHAAHSTGLMANFGFTF